MEITTSSQEETAKTAQNLARELTGTEFIALYGTLGMGKTVFARALIRALAGDESLEVPSPTFTLVQEYDGRAGPVRHFDLYRLEDPEEIYELGWEDALASGIVIAEWPERLGALLPAKRLDIRFSKTEDNPDHRIIKITKVSP